LPLLLLTTGLGFLLSLLNALYRDISSMLTVLTSFLLFLTPVLYPAPESGTLAELNRYNPVAGLIVAAKDLVFTGRLPNPEGYAIATAVSLAVFLFGWRLFHLAEERVAERVGAQ
jgi:lipopolysaccharide transport system permease protein